MLVTIADWPQLKTGKRDINQEMIEGLSLQAFRAPLEYLSPDFVRIKVLQESRLHDAWNGLIDLPWRYVGAVNWEDNSFEKYLTYLMRFNKAGDKIPGEEMIKCEGYLVEYATFIKFVHPISGEVSDCKLHKALATVNRSWLVF